MNTTTKALAALKHIETQFEKLGSNLTFTEITELAVAIHEVKSALQIIKDKEDALTHHTESLNHSRAKYKKFILVTNDGTHHPMKHWLSNHTNVEFQQLASKISHEISRILVNKYHFRKTVDTNANLVLHFHPN